MRSPVRVTRKARDPNGRAHLLHVSKPCRYGRCRLGLLLRGLPRPRTPAQPLGLGYALRKLRDSGFMARAAPCALLPPSAPPCSLLLHKVATCPLVLESGGMIPISGLAPTSFKTRAHSAPRSGVRSGLGSAPATLRLYLLFARGKAQPPAGFFIGYRLPNVAPICAWVLRSETLRTRVCFLALWAVGLHPCASYGLPAYYDFCTCKNNRRL